MALGDEFVEWCIADIKNMSDCNSILQEIIYWINNNLLPDDVFDEVKLREWAALHGYCLPKEKI